jgi:hypothetical protein
MAEADVIPDDFVGPESWAIIMSRITRFGRRVSHGGLTLFSSARRPHLCHVLFLTHKAAHSTNSSPFTTVSSLPPSRRVSRTDQTPSQLVMCWAGPKAQSPPKPGPFEPGPAQPTGGLESGLGWACNMRKPKAWAQARALRI